MSIGLLLVLVSAGGVGAVRPRVITAAAVDEWAGGAPRAVPSAGGRPVGAQVTEAGEPVRVGRTRATDRHRCAVVGGGHDARSLSRCRTARTPTDSIARAA